jgi:uncharacterized repeat protein (TIGR03803 family)
MSHVKSLALASVALLLSPPLQASSLTTVYSIPSTGDGADPNGLLLNVDGTLYGTTSAGGTSITGTVFKLDPTTGTESTLYSFGPRNGAPRDGNGPSGGLIKIGDTLYGTTSGGGGGNNGTIYAVNPISGGETVLYSFGGINDGSGPFGNLINMQGILYGMTGSGGANSEGAVFEFNPLTGAERTLYSFPGYPQAPAQGAGLIGVGGMLYGTTYNGGTFSGGTLFSLDPATGAEETLYNFGSGQDGSAPRGQITVVGNAIYGTTGAGGTSGMGTVFKFDIATGQESIAASFSGKNGSAPAGNLLMVGDWLYGTTTSSGRFNSGTAFKINVATGQLATLYDFPAGTYAAGGLVKVGDSVVGTAPSYPGQGGPPSAQALGAIFEMNLRSKIETILHTFSGPLGWSINPGLTNVNGLLYGVANAGAAAGAGGIYGYDPAGGGGSVISSFPPAYFFAGANINITPLVSALVNVNGALYGTTAADGADAAGSVFEVDPVSRAMTTLYSFGGINLSHPVAALSKAGDLLYGTASFGSIGGGDPSGGVFTIDPATGAEKSLYWFGDGAGGANPSAALLTGNGLLYGTTVIAGSGGCGTIFAVAPSGAEVTLHSFTGTDGCEPASKLARIGNILYGTTVVGNNSNCHNAGGLFGFDLDMGTITTSVCLPGLTFAQLANVGGVLYGTTVHFGIGTDALYKLDPATGALTTLYTFTGGQDGATPYGGLIKVGNAFYGTTSQGGAWGIGTVFKFTP